MPSGHIQHLIAIAVELFAAPGPYACDALHDKRLLDPGDLLP